MTHSDLCTLAVKWLKRPNSAGGHGCQVAVSECRSGWDGEIPDAIGFRTGTAASLTAGSVVVEVKVSRSDFLADRARAIGRDESTYRDAWRPMYEWLWHRLNDAEAAAAQDFARALGRGRAQEAAA